MSRPQFPDPLGFREVDRPGATAHKAGPDALRRIQALEQGAAGRPGPGVSNGSVLTSDTSQTGGVAWQAPAIAKVTRSSAFSWAAATTTLISWDVNDFATPSSMHSTSSNTSRVIAPTTGYYLALVQVTVDNNSAASSFIQIRKNAAGATAGGTEMANGNFGPNVGNSFNKIATISTGFSLTAGDYLEVFGFQNTAGSVSSTFWYNAPWTHFTLVRVW